MDLIPTEILQEIIQDTVDEGASILDHTKGFTDINNLPPLVAPTTLTLVCRRWKETVDDTPSLWSVFIVDTSLARDQVGVQYNQRVRLSKQASIDLYILFSPVKNKEWIESPAPRDLECANDDPLPATTISNTQNVRKLDFSFSESNALAAHISSFLPPTEQMQDIKILFRDTSNKSNRMQPIQMDLYLMDKNFGKLVKLYIGEPNSIALEWAGDKPLFPNLCELGLGSGRAGTASTQGVAQIISHCPAIKTLDLATTSMINYPPGQFMPFKLDNLRTLICLGSKDALGLFEQGRIEANYIHSYECQHWSRSYNQPTRNFLASHLSIKEVALHIHGPEEWADALSDAPLIESLKIVITCDMKEETLAPLIRPTRLFPNPVLMVPSLKRLHLDLSSISVRWFKKFVEARCLAARGTRTTKMNCLPLEYVELRLPKWNAPFLQGKLEEAAEWQRAEVIHTTEASQEIYQLRWLVGWQRLLRAVVSWRR